MREALAEVIRMWSPPAKEPQNSGAPAVISLSESFPGQDFCR
jgi:hypothetical protein